MNNVSMDFISGFNSMMAGLADVNSADLTGSQGVNFVELLKKAASDVPSAKAFLSAANEGIPDTEDIVNFDSAFSQLFQKMSSADDETLKLCKNFLSVISKMFNSEVSEDENSSFSDLFDLSADSKISFGDDILSRLFSGLTIAELEKSVQISFADKIPSAEVITDSLDILSDFADLIGKAFSDETITDNDAVQKLYECISLLPFADETADSDVSAVRASERENEEDGTDIDYINSAAELLAGLLSVPTESLPDLMNVSSENSEDAISEQKADTVDTNKLSEALKRVSTAISFITGKETINGKGLADIKVDSDVQNSDDSIFVKLLEVKTPKTEIGNQVFSGAFNTAMPKIFDATAQINAYNSKTTAVSSNVNLMDSQNLNGTSEENTQSELSDGLAKSLNFATESNKQTNSLDNNLSAFNIFNIPHNVTSNITSNNTSDVLPAYTADSVEVQVTEQIGAKLFEASQNDGVSELTIILKPENLGEIAVKITSDKNVVSIVMAAQNEAVGKTLESRIANLASGLTNQNVEVKNINVINPTEAESQMGLDFTNQGFNRRQNSEASETDNNSSHRKLSVNGIDEPEALDSVKSEQVNVSNLEGKLWALA